MITIEFVSRSGAPSGLVIEAEVHFHDGPLAGTKFVSFSICRSAEGELYVTMPSRPFGIGAERRFFEVLRTSEANPAVIRRIKDWILTPTGRPGSLPDRQEAGAGDHSRFALLAAIRNRGFLASVVRGLRPWRPRRVFSS